MGKRNNGVPHDNNSEGKKQKQKKVRILVDFNVPAKTVREGKREPRRDPSPQHSDNKRITEPRFQNNTTVVSWLKETQRENHDRDTQLCLRCTVFLRAG